MASAHDKKVKMVSFHLDDLVMLFQKESGKLKPRWRGPFRISRMRVPGTLVPKLWYRIRRMSTEEDLNRIIQIGKEDPTKALPLPLPVQTYAAEKDVHLLAIWLRTACNQLSTRFQQRAIQHFFEELSKDLTLDPRVLAAQIYQEIAAPVLYRQGGLAKWNSDPVVPEIVLDRIGSRERLAINVPGFKESDLLDYYLGKLEQVCRTIGNLEAEVAHWARVQSGFNAKTYKFFRENFNAQANSTGNLGEEAKKFWIERVVPSPVAARDDFHLSAL
ncbi:MAG: hypothetical protein Q9220_000885 [cf. Caloplaca sp. 1 TL-2023]